MNLYFVLAFIGMVVLLREFMVLSVSNFKVLKDIPIICEHDMFDLDVEYDIRVGVNVVVSDPSRPAPMTWIMKENSIFFKYRAIGGERYAILRGSKYSKLIDHIRKTRRR